MHSTGCHSSNEYDTACCAWQEFLVTVVCMLLLAVDARMAVPCLILYVLKN